MTRHRSGLWLVILGLVFFCSSVWGQGVAQIPVDVRTAVSLNSTQQKLIADAITAEMTKMQSDDPAAQQSARDALSEALRDRGELKCSPAFSRQFALVLNQAMLDLPADAQLRVRLNAAIATDRVAELAKSSMLSRAARKFMADESMPVALWGVKSARWILPYEAAASALFSANNDLLVAITRAVAQHDTEPVIDEAYNTLGLLLNDPSVPKPPAESLRIVAAVMQNLLQQRIALYANGPIAQPLTEVRAVNFLAHPDVYRAEDQAAHLQTVQLTVQLLEAAIKNAAAATGDDRAVYLQLTRDMANVITVIGGYEKNPPIQTAARALAQVQNNTTAPEIDAAKDAVLKALKAIPAFKDVQTAAAS
ncbi:MAG: hypothetical protein IT448_07515 [Phycisphaerales bacterium]|nr:hypothetical protein [Phycisphaerales bacterium]